MIKIRLYLDNAILKIIYFTLVYPYLIYCANFIYDPGGFKAPPPLYFLILTHLILEPIGRSGFSFNGCFKI